MVILVTGVSSGFGKSIAAKLVACGHTVYGTSRSVPEDLPGVRHICADSTSDEQVESAVRQVVEAEGCIDVFINNAGMGIGGPLEFNSISEARRQMDVNFMGMVRFIHSVLPVMRAQKYGKIIVLSSIGGLMGLPFQGMYSASKYAIEGYCEALRLEIRQFGIKVVVVEPGDFSTGFTAKRASVDCQEAFDAYPSYKKSLESIQHDENNGLKPELLAETMAKIVQCKNPSYSYVVSTFTQKLSIFLKAVLPAPWFAKLLGMYYKL